MASDRAENRNLDVAFTWVATAVLGFLIGGWRTALVSICAFFIGSLASTYWELDKKDEERGY